MNNNTIKTNREKCGISQQALAKEMGLKSNNRISRWENGLAYPGAKNIFKLAAILRIDPRDLYPEQNPDTSEIPAQ